MGFRVVDGQPGIANLQVGSGISEGSWESSKREGVSLKPWVMGGIKVAEKGEGTSFPSISVLSDNIHQFQQTAAVGNFVQRNPPNLANQMFKATKETKADIKETISIRIKTVEAISTKDKFTNLQRFKP
ncbi:hypothetical protein Tco_0724526 [Tanacetum coccineum]